MKKIETIVLKAKKAFILKGFLRFYEMPPIFDIIHIEIYK